MVRFKDIIGNKEVVRHLKNSIKSGKIAHSYIFTGDAGAGKKLLATAFATALQCEMHGSDACGRCPSCKKAEGKNHPDIIFIDHEKENLISIDEIRQKLVDDVYIRPYSSKYKIYIIPDAELMNERAQNAILKTIEEPPEYIVIILLTTNINSLLPTIQSRCVRLDLRVVEDSLIKKYLMEHMHVPDYEADIHTSYAQGSIGRAEEAASSQYFQEITSQAVTLMKNVDKMSVPELIVALKTIAAEKGNIQNYLEIFQFWFRDVLMFKATKEIDKLVFKQEILKIREQASYRSYENLENILEALEKAKLRLSANVSTDTSLELLFLTIKEK